MVVQSVGYPTEYPYHGEANVAVSFGRAEEGVAEAVALELVGKVAGEVGAGFDEQVVTAATTATVIASRLQVFTSPLGAATH